MGTKTITEWSSWADHPEGGGAGSWTAIVNAVLYPASPNGVIPGIGVVYPYWGVPPITYGTFGPFGLAVTYDGGIGTPPAPTHAGGEVAPAVDTYTAGVWAADSPDGPIVTGPSADLGTNQRIGGAAGTWEGSLYATFSNPILDKIVYLVSISGTYKWVERYQIITTIVTPDPTTEVPVSPTAVLTPRQYLEKLNPGFTGRIVRNMRYEDLGTILPGQRVNLTANNFRARLGMVARGHIINRVQIDWITDASAQTAPSETIKTTVEFEKIPGTLLPGSGTSTAAQDDTADGGVIETLYFSADVVGAGADQGIAI